VISLRMASGAPLGCCGTDKTKWRCFVWCRWPVVYIVLMGVDGYGAVPGLLARPVRVNASLVHGIRYAEIVAGEWQAFCGHRPRPNFEVELAQQLWAGTLEGVTCRHCREALRKLFGRAGRQGVEVRDQRWVPPADPQLLLMETPEFLVWLSRSSALDGPGIGALAQAAGLLHNQYSELVWVGLAARADLPVPVVMKLRELARERAGSTYKNDQSVGYRILRQLGVNYASLLDPLLLPGLPGRDTATAEELASILLGRWRVGAEAKRNIFWQRGDKPLSDDPLVGVLDSAELAQHVVRLHNEVVRRRDARARGAGGRTRQPSGRGRGRPRQAAVPAPAG